MDGPCFLCYCLKGFFEILAPLCVGSVRRYSFLFVSCEMRMASPDQLSIFMGRYIQASLLCSRSLLSKIHSNRGPGLNLINLLKNRNSKICGDFRKILAPLCVGSVRRYSRSFVSCEMRSYCLLTRDKVKRLKGYRMSVLRGAQLTLVQSSSQNGKKSTPIL